MAGLTRNLARYYTGTKLYCLVTQAEGCEQLAQCYEYICSSDNDRRQSERTYTRKWL